MDSQIIDDLVGCDARFDSLADRLSRDTASYHVRVPSAEAGEEREDCNLKGRVYLERGSMLANRFGEVKHRGLSEQL